MRRAVLAETWEAEDRYEEELWRVFRQTRSVQAREAVFDAYFPFARAAASRELRRRADADLELGDLVQLASAGLLEAIDNFDPSRGTRFRPYAARRIRGSIVDGIGKMSELREQLSYRRRVRAERVRLLAAENIDSLSASQALEALVDASVGLALGFMLEESVAHAPGDASANLSAYESLAWKETVQRTLAAVTDLPERERSVISHHYLGGLDFAQVAALLGVGKSRVSQLHQAAINTLRRRLAANRFKLEQ